MDENQDPILENNDSEVAPVTAKSADVLLNMEGLIKSHISSIDRLQEQVEKHQSLLDNIFENDSTYKEHEKDAKEAARIKSATKQQILKQPQAADLFNKVKTFRSELKEHKASLSDYLREYQKMSGLTEIEGDDGETREIVYSAKLVKKSSKYRP